jgi:hypothetical protein
VQSDKTDWLSAPIGPSHVYSDKGVGQTFLQGAGTDPVGAPTAGIKGHLANLLGGGGQLTTDLTNFGNLIGSLGQGKDPSHGFGSPTTHNTVIGAAGQLDNQDKPVFKDLLPKDPHSGG